MKYSSCAEIREAIAAMPGPDRIAEAKWAAREPTLTKPQGSLGRLEEIGHHLSCWQGRHPPQAETIAVRVFAGNHGIAARGVSAFPPEVTVQMVANFRSGGAAINQLCRTFGMDLDVVSLDLDRPTADFSVGPAMSDAECAAAFSAGYDSVPEGIDLLVLGEMGIGNTTSAAAIAHALFGGQPGDWVGRGTGVDDRQLAFKTGCIAQSVRVNPAKDGLGVLAALGGRELAAMAGAVLAARQRRIPVMLDGYVCTAAVATLFAEDKTALDHCLVGHVSAEPGHKRLLEILGKKPLLELGMRLGEASGAAVAVALVKAAVACHTGMASFAEAGVSDRPV